MMLHMMTVRGRCFALGMLALGMGLISSLACAADLHGRVLLQKQAVAQAEVSLWQTIPGAPAKKQQSTKTNAQGEFDFTDLKDASSARYVIATGGQVQGTKVPALRLLSVLGTKPISNVVLNEITTIGSVWPNAQLLSGTNLQGSAVALGAGASNVRNLADIATGHYGDTLLNASNLTSSTTMARINTLASLVDLCGRRDNTACKAFLGETQQKDTLGALTVIARQPWHNAAELYGLFTQEYPVNPKTQQRTGAWVPYLQYGPKDFALMVRFEGGGIYAPGKLAFDKNGSLWSGQNWMPGSQSNVNRGLGGGTVRLTSCGKSLSPDLMGLRDGIDGVGWGTAASANKIWIAGFSHNVAVYDTEGNHLATINQINGQSFGMLQGLGVGANDDVWITDTTGAQLLYFPGADEKKGQIVKVAGLNFPFAVALDAKNRVWVTNSESGNVVMFPGDNPKAAKTIATGSFGLRGLAIDSQGNVWVAVTTSPGFEGNKNIKKSSNIMQEFKVGLEALLKYSSPKNPTGMLAMISPAGKLKATFGSHSGLYVPWGVSVDGSDHVWVANFMGQGIVQFCGVNTDACPKGSKTGDIIHTYQSGILQHVTDNIVDAAGNVWAANNWDDVQAVISDKPAQRISTNAGGKGIVVIYGIAKPVSPPLLGVYSSGNAPSNGAVKK